MSDLPRLEAFTPPLRPSQDEEYDEEAFEPRAAPPAAREGLPPDFRMRHDAHYVDHVLTRSVPITRLVSVRVIDGPRPPGGRDLAPLVASIGRFGVLQPLLVRRRNGRYLLIDGARRLAAAMAAGLEEVPCLVHDVDEDGARALGEATRTRAGREEAPTARQPAHAAIPAAALGEITGHLDAIASCLTLFQEGGRPLRERVARDLMRAEIQRAARLAQGLAVLAEDPVLAQRPVDVGPLLERVVQSMQPERVLSHFEVRTAIPAMPGRVHADEPLLSVALAGALAAMQALVERMPGAVLDCACRPDPARSTMVLAITEHAVTLPASRLARFFDPGWPERPGGYRAAIGVLAARRIAQLHAGTLVVSAGDEGGCTLRLDLPLEPSET